MKRFNSVPRSQWQEKVESIGLTYHTHDIKPYWSEDAYYLFAAPEIDKIEKATNDLHEMCIAAAEKVINEERWSELGIPESAIPVICASWDRDDFSLYGRFDLAYDGNNPPKMLEYNADTPTALIEAALAQWFWKEECHSSFDQFNSLHEALIEAWRKCPVTQVHFTGVADHLEDNQTVSYLMDTAIQAGLETKWLAINDVSYNTELQEFVDTEISGRLHGLFKLYPWEWMFREEFGKYLNSTRVQFIEPPWKALLSTKGLLPILWEMFPDHPNLLPAYRTPEKLGNNYIKKPILSREGANISVTINGALVFDSYGEYGEEGFIYQALAKIPSFDGYKPVIGSWVINHYACGIGIREDDQLVTGNLSRFTPHLFS